MRRLLIAGAVFAGLLAVTWALSTPTAVAAALAVGTAVGLTAWVIGDVLHRRL